MKNSTVTIIILNWNNFKDTIECLKSVRHITYQDYSVLVIDNGSTSENVSQLQKFCKKEKLICLKQNSGFTGGANAGIKYALEKKPEYILLLNNDTVVEPRFLEELVKEAKSNNTVGIVGPLIYFFGSDHQIWFAGGKIDYKCGPFLHQYSLPKKNNFSPFSVDYINGCCMLIKTQVLKEIGFLDEDYESYVEDIDFNFRAQLHAYHSFLVPTAKIWHKVSASTGGEGNPKKGYLKARNQILFAKKRLKGKNKRVYLTYYTINKLKEIFVNVINLRLLVTVAIIRGMVDGIFYEINIR